MSIWCTILGFHADDHADDCGRWVPCTRDEADASGRGMYGNDRFWRYDSALPCTCAAGPLAYQRSHVVPLPEHPREGRFDLASVASHIGPDHEYRDDPDETHLPYLRVSLRGSDAEPDTVVLDRTQVRKLHAATGHWLAYCDSEVES